MNWIAEDAISLLMFLAPGLFAVAVFRSLTSYPPSSPFDQIVQALIFTIVVQIACWGIVDKFGIGNAESGPHWTNPYPPYATFPIATILATILAATFGNDTFHRLLRRRGITRETSFPSEWYSAFHRHTNCYVVLYLAQGTCVYGWPEEWPSQPDKGHFRLSEYAWLTRDEVDGTVIFTYTKQEQLKQAAFRESILIPVSEVGMVEFMRELSDDEEERS